MILPFNLRSALHWMAAASAAVLLSAITFVAALDAGYGRDALLHFMVARAGREVQVSGALRVHFLSLQPQLTAEQVIIGNPPWMPAGTAAEIGKLTIVFSRPRLGRSFDIERLALQSATLHLSRAADGRANWQRSDPSKFTASGLPLIHSLSMPGARVLLDDRLRHLRFDGIVTARDVPQTSGLPILKIDCAGELNGKAADIEIAADPLADASLGRPYHFTFSEHGSDTDVAGRGRLLQAFFFDAIDATFTAVGANLKDLYFLTGVRLVNSGAYRLAGKFERRGVRSTFSDLELTAGKSDLRGTVAIESKDGRPNLHADFTSQLLRTADFGVRAAGRMQDSAAGSALLLSSAALSPAAVRHGEAAVNFHVQRVDVGSRSLHVLAGTIAIEHGVLVVAPLSAEVLGGKLVGKIRVDAKTDTPAVDVDLKITDAQLAKLKPSEDRPAAVDGLLRMRITATGRGASIHAVGASANGTVTAVLPGGTIRASLAELAGIDLRGLGLLLEKNTQQVAIRCGIASFQARGGVLTAQTLVLDTEPVQITGGGTIRLDSEAVDLVLRGRPKSLRLGRLRSPLMVRGTLAHPLIAFEARASLAQAAEAVALGVVLTPLASVLAFVDPGLATNADCAALLAENR